VTWYGTPVATKKFPIETHLEMKDSCVKNLEKAEYDK
jgi:hypothetical protein